MNSNRLIYWHLEKIGWNSENNYMVVYLYFVLLAQDRDQRLEMEVCMLNKPK